MYRKASEETPKLLSHRFSARPAEIARPESSTMDKASEEIPKLLSHRFSARPAEIAQPESSTMDKASEETRKLLSHRFSARPAEIARPESSTMDKASEETPKLLSHRFSARPAEIARPESSTMDKASEETLKLITHRCSPYAQRVHIMLLEKGISCENIPVDFAHKPQVLLDTNPMWTKVPVLIHAGKPVSESLVILEYLEEVWPEQVPLMPKGAYTRSQVRFWADYIEKELTAFIAYWKLPSNAPDKQAGGDATVKLVRTLDTVMTSHSADGPFFSGSEFGFLDVVLTPFAGALPFIELVDGLVIPGPDENSRFHRWLEAVKARPSVSASLPSAQEYIVFFNELAAQNLARQDLKEHCTSV